MVLPEAITIVGLVSVDGELSGGEGRRRKKDRIEWDARLGIK